MTQQEDRFADGLDDRDDVANLVLERVVLGCVRLAAAAAGNRIDGELLLEGRLDEFPIGVVIAEGAVHEHERWAAAALVVRDGYPVGGRETFHDTLLASRFQLVMPETTEKSLTEPGVGESFHPALLAHATIRPPPLLQVSVRRTRVIAAPNTRTATPPAATIAAQEPLVKLLGTPTEHKLRREYDAAHSIPRMIKVVGLMESPRENRTPP